MARPSGPLENRFLRFLILTALVLGFFIAAESAFRLYNRLKGGNGEGVSYLPNPDRMWEISGHDFRDPAVKKEKPPGTFRIFCMGDSSAFGFGVKINETYSYYLADLLKDAAPDKRVEVINAGVPGYTSEQGIYFLTDVVSKYEPDLVTFAYLNCDSLMDTMSDEKRMKRDPKVVRGARKLFFMSDFYKALKKELAPVPGEGVQIMDVKSIEPRTSVARFRENLMRLGRYCAERSIRFLFINPPADLHVPHQEGYRDCIREAARRRGAPVVDAFVEWMRSPQPGLYLDFAHPTAKGHRRLADEIAGTIRKFGLLLTTSIPVPADAPFYRRPEYIVSGTTDIADYMYPKGRVTFSRRDSLPPWTCFQSVISTEDGKDKVMEFYRTGRGLPLAGRFDQGESDDTLLADYLIHTQYPASEIDGGHMVLISENRKTKRCTAGIVVLKRTPSRQ
jgi:lysophospholipase L1-like esterase